jgi:hypothetical protein
VGEAPVLDFDNSESFAGIHMMTLMCWPDPAERKSRLSTYAAVSLDDPLTKMISEALLAVGNLESPTRDNVEHVIETFTDMPLARQWLKDFVDSFEPVLLQDGRQIATPFEHFLYFCRRPNVRDGLRGLPQNALRTVQEQLIEPAGGLGSLGRGPAYDDMIAEINALCDGHAMISGLVVALLACCEHNHADDFDPSFNRICFLLDASPEYKISTSTIKVMWPRWRAISPLWAGVIAEAGYQDPGATRFAGVLVIEERRERAIAYAQWFACYATHPRMDGKMPSLLDKQEVVKFETSIQALRPPLPPLERAAADIARSYTTKLVKKSLRTKKIR